MGNLKKASLCAKKKCGDEAACLVLPNSTAVCVCPHDHSPPLPDGSCPRRVVIDTFPRNVNVKEIKSAQHINMTFLEQHHQQRTDLVRLLDTQEEDSSATTDHDGLTAVLAVFLLLSFVALSIVGSGFWLKTRRRKKEAQMFVDTITSVDSGAKADPQGCVFNPSYGLVEETENLNISQVARLPRENLTLLSKLGEGCFGVVFKGKLASKNGCKNVAVKILKSRYTDSAAADSIRREAHVMSTFSHQNIITFLGLVHQGSVPWLVFEFMAYGDLSKILRAETPLLGDDKSIVSLQQEDLFSVAWQIASGMEYLSRRRFVHRDLACRNCLVDENFVVKIADFGMSRDVYASDYYKVGGSKLLPVRWMAPEAIVYGRYTLESDVWSYGIVLWEIFSWGKQPYYGFSNEEAVKIILRGTHLTPPNECPKIIREIMRGCFQRETKKRPTFIEITTKLKSGSEFEHFYQNITKIPDYVISECYLQPRKPESGYFGSFDEDSLESSLAKVDSESSLAKSKAKKAELSRTEHSFDSGIQNSESEKVETPQDFSVL
ncbi:tyrosine-protein kinase transmembrane receptor Ror-like isoform X1 [Artemia franciscana]|uniref:tyrosine-protein kinase transmembrane receptor Ror-like isoform X1 n=1 Tax=Artemia franciscana TaxID=6661 RepID=UPI0032DA65EB